VDYLRRKMSKEIVETKINDYSLKIETGEIARQANGSVLITMGETQILTTVCAANKPKPDMGFFPLTVEYRTRTYAAGKIPGGFFKREGKPPTDDVLSARLIDRPIRPRFPKDFLNETQVFSIPISFDGENDPDVLGILGASAALSISDIPFDGPFGALRVCYIGEEFVANPTFAQREQSVLDLIIAGTGTDIVMVEGNAFEVSEELLADAMEFAKPILDKLCEVQNELIKKAGKEKFEYEPSGIPDEELVKAVEAELDSEVDEVIRIADKKKRRVQMDLLQDRLTEKLEEKFPESSGDISNILHDIEREKMRAMILNENKRIDGRDIQEIRPITIVPNYLKRTHGSGLFTRGETQALAVLTLGTKMDEQKIEDLEGESSKSFMLHYNFPPFSVGEVRRAGAPSRREIGHGMLAERSLVPVIPKEEMFPYTIRIVSDILESNGSSSMATVCAGSISLMDAGVPIKSPVAGIAMGLITEGDKYAILTDILGAEDHMGDMDFKVAGTKEGITAFQMDVKVNGISMDIIREGLSRAKEGREYILGLMNEKISEPRDDISPYAPRIVSIQINPDKIGAVIGSGGKTIRNIQDVTGTTIAIEDDGTVQIAAVDADGLEAALNMVKELTEEAEVGKIYNGKIVRITDFGAFIQILPNQDGLLHVSEYEHKRTDNLNSILNVGDYLEVKVIGISRDGKIRLSRKALLPKPDRHSGRDNHGSSRGHNSRDNKH